MIVLPKPCKLKTVENCSHRKQHCDKYVASNAKIVVKIEDVFAEKIAVKLGSIPHLFPVLLAVAEERRAKTIRGAAPPKH